MMRRDRDERPGLRQLHEASYLVSTAQQQLVARYRQAGSYSPGRVRALNVLMREPEATAGELADEAGLRANSITAMLDQLELGGVIRRHRDEDDLRVWRVSLTDKGRAEMAELQEQWDRAFEEAFATTSERDLKIASTVLERLAEVFRNFEIPTSG
jgi:DNA-binding MarR family transcriptional regulator